VTRAPDSKIGIGKEASGVVLQEICRGWGIAIMSGGFAHPDMSTAVAESIPKGSARVGVVCRHCIAAAMLCHTTSPLRAAESTLDSSSPLRVWRGYINRMLRSTNE
jgi:hypothetical protein